MSRPRPTTALVSTESRILEEASRLFYAKGYHATTMREVAAAVGIQAPSLYNHFRAGKEEILVRICLDTAKEFYEGAVQAAEDCEDVRERLRTLICWQVEYEAAHPYVARVADNHIDALGRESREQCIWFRDAYERLIHKTLVQGQAQGIWHLSHPRVICIGIVSMCKVDAWYNEDGPLAAEQIGELYARFTLSALEHGTEI